MPDNEPSAEALRRAHDAVEALPSHLFDRAHTEEIARNLAPDFDAAHRRGIEEANTAAEIIRGLMPYADGHELRECEAAKLSELKRRGHAFLRALAPPQEGS